MNDYIAERFSFLIGLNFNPHTHSSSFFLS
jgi:hypothetical protein